MRYRESLIAAIGHWISAASTALANWPLGRKKRDPKYNLPLPPPPPPSSREMCVFMFLSCDALICRRRIYCGRTHRHRKQRKTIQTFFLPPPFRFSSLRFAVGIGAMCEILYVVHNVATCPFAFPSVPRVPRRFGSRIGFLSRCRTSACVSALRIDHAKSKSVQVFTSGKISPFLRARRLSFAVRFRFFPLAVLSCFSASEFRVKVDVKSNTRDSVNSTRALQPSFRMHCTCRECTNRFLGF